MLNQIPGKGDYNFIDLFAGAGNRTKLKRHQNLVDYSINNQYNKNETQYT